MPVTGAAVRGRALELAYGDQTAVGVSDFEIPAGTITAIIGPNGSGKSTLLHAIAGLLEPAAGELIVQARRQLGYVLQTTKVNAEIPVTVFEVVSMGRYGRLGLFGRFTTEDRQACREAMERLALTDLATRHLDELSVGQRQRVFVAQGLAQQADLLLLDEPITGLDIISRERILGAVADERARGATVIVTTHDLAEAAEADHVVLLSGRVVAWGPPALVLTNENLSAAYGISLITTDAGTVVLDDPSHGAVVERHIHFDRTGHADQPREG